MYILSSRKKYSCMEHNESFGSSKELDAYAKQFHKIRPDTSFVYGEPILVTSNKWMDYRSSLKFLNVRDLNQFRYIS
jgi:hypothetical protein